MLKSIIPYVGSKQRCLDSILPYISVESEVYIEPFCGSCAVAIAMLQTRPNHFKHIILADKNEELVNFWRYIQSTPESLDLDLRNFLDSYSDSALVELSTDNKLEMLLRKYVMLKCSYMSCEKKGLVDSKLYSLRTGFTDKSKDEVLRLSELLNPATFLCDSFEVSVSKGLEYGLVTSCFADPPYRENKLSLTDWYSGNNFIDLVDLHRYVSMCDNFVLSHSKDDLLEAVFKGYKFRTRSLHSFYMEREEVYIYK